MFLVGAELFYIRKLGGGRVKRGEGGQEEMKQYSGHQRESIINRQLNLLISAFPDFDFFLIGNNLFTFRLTSRHQALVQLGMINSPSDVPAFARDL